MQRSNGTLLRAAKHPCRQVVSEQANGQPLHCFSTYRNITVDKGKVKMTCGNGHPINNRTKYARLLNPLTKRERGK